MKLAIALAASILSLTTLDARAAAPADAYSVTVQFADLDLDREAGIARLYLRIKGAARRVCDDQASDLLSAKQSYLACVNRAVSEAVAHIDRPQLSNYVAQHGQRAKTAPLKVAAR